MTDAARPLPAFDSDSAHYWKEAREGRLTLQRCEDCRELQFYPRVLCVRCGSQTLTWQEMSGRATVYSFTTVHRQVEPGIEPPYVVALVDLEEGPRLPTNLVDVQEDEVTIGLPVEVSFLPLSDEIGLPVFRPLKTG